MLSPQFLFSAVSNLSSVAHLNYSCDKRMENFKPSFLIYAMKYLPKRRDLFISILQILTNQEIIKDSEKDLWIEKYDENPDKKIAVDGLLPVLINLKVDICQMMFVESNINSEWKKLINEVKDEKVNQYEIITLPDCSPIQKLKTGDVTIFNQLIGVTRSENRSNELPEFSNSTCDDFFRILHQKFDNIIIQGESGIGKTTQYKYLTYLWANNQLAGIENLLLLNISLEYFEKGHNVHDTIIEQNFKNFSFMTKNLIRVLMNENKEKIILLIDGADELKRNHNINVKEFIETAQSFARTIVWLKDWKSIEIHYDFLFELKGFNNEQLNIFLSRCFCKKSDKINNFVKNLKNFKLRYLCKIPIFALNFFILYTNDEKILTNSKYEIFTKLINLNDSDAKIMKKFMKACFNHLSNTEIECELSDNELSIIKKKIDNLSKITNKSNSNKNIYIIEFHHFCIQEYFASRYLIDKTTNAFYGFGINNYFTKIPTKSLFSILELIKCCSIDSFTRILADSRSVQERYIFDENLKMFIESEDILDKVEIFKKNIINNSLLELLIERHYLAKEIRVNLHEKNIITALEAIGKFCTNLRVLEINSSTKKCLNNLNSFNAIRLFLDKILSNSMIKILIIKKFWLHFENDSIELKKKNKTGTKYIYIKFKNSNKTQYFGDSFTNNLFTLLFNYFYKKKKKEIQILKINDIEYLSKKKYEFGLCSVQNLEIENCSISVNNFKHFICKCFELNTLYMTNVKSDDISYDDIFGYLNNCGSSLRILIFSDCSFLLKSAHEVCSSLMHFHQIKSIDFSCNPPMKRGFIPLLYGMQSSHLTLENIDFSDCGIDDRFAYMLENSLSSFCLLKNVNFSENENFKYGFKHLLKGLLNSKSTLQVLNLKNCGIRTRDVPDAEYILIKFTSLKNIDFSANPFLEFGCFPLLSGLNNSQSTLETLSLYGYKILNQDIKKLNDTFQNSLKIDCK